MTFLCCIKNSAKAVEKTSKYLVLCHTNLTGYLS